MTEKKKFAVCVTIISVSVVPRPFPDFGSCLLWCGTTTEMAGAAWPTPAATLLMLRYISTPFHPSYFILLVLVLLMLLVLVLVLIIPYLLSLEVVILQGLFHWSNVTVASHSGLKHVLISGCVHDDTEEFPASLPDQPGTLWSFRPSSLVSVE